MLGKQMAWVICHAGRDDHVPALQRLRAQISAITSLDEASACVAVSVPGGRDQRVVAMEVIASVPNVQRSQSGSGTAPSSR